MCDDLDMLPFKLAHKGQIKFLYILIWFKLM